MRKNQDLSRAVRLLETFREAYYLPNKKQRTVLKNAEKKAEAILLQGMLVAANKNVLTPVTGRRKSPIKTYNLTNSHKQKKGRFVVATR